jgi:nitroreductase
LNVLRDLVFQTRSTRRFVQHNAVDRQHLVELVDLARLSASAANKQPLKFALSFTPQDNRLIFPCLGWAAYLKDWPGPAEGERPAAYIVILGDRGIAASCDCDLGIAAQSIVLGAREKGLGACMIGSIDRKKLQQALGLPAGLDILLVVALGEPAETVVVETVGPDGDVRYWRDARGVHHVPKRRLEDILVATRADSKA